MIPVGILASAHGVGASRWSPGDLSHPLLVWCDDESQLDVSGVGISEWRDRGSHGWRFTQATLSSRPVVLADALNGRRAVRFDGSNDYLSCNIPQMQRGVPAGWAFTVYRKRGSDSTGAARVVLYCPTASNATRFNVQAGGPTANAPSLNVRRLDNDSTAALDSGIGLVGEWVLRLDLMEWSVGTGRIYLNGTKAAENQSLTTTGNTDNTAPHDYGTSIGATGLGSAAADADVAAVLVGSGSAPSSDEIEKLFGWAAHRYGLAGSLPGNHPYKDAPP